MQADASGQGPKRRAQGDSGDSRKRKQLRKPSAAEEEDSDESILSESEEIPSTLGDHDEIVPASDSGSSHSSNLVPDPHGREGAEKLEGIAPFVSKCYNLVSDTRLHDIIRWSEAGDSFIIYNTQKFASDILPKSFKHNNFSSFVRQLNLYGFRRRVSNQVNVEFFHESFRRDAKHLLRRIGRQKPITAKQEMAKQQAAQDTVDVRITQLEERLNNQGQELRDVQDDMNTLRRANTVLKTEVSTWRGHCENLVSVMNFGYSIAQAQQQNASAAAAPRSPGSSTRRGQAPRLLRPLPSPPPGPPRSTSSRAACRCLRCRCSSRPRPATAATAAPAQNPPTVTATTVTTAPRRSRACGWAGSGARGVWCAAVSTAPRRRRSRPGATPLALRWATR